MKRRNFVQLCLALSGVPFLPKVAAKPAPLPPLNPHDPFCGVGEPGNIPVGYITRFSGKLPKGWLPVDGRTVSRLEYNSLFSAIGTTYGKGDGLTTFGLPDLTTSYSHGIKDPGHRHGLEIFREHIIKAK